VVFYLAKECTEYPGLSLIFEADGDTTKKEVVEKHLNLTLPFYQQCSTTDSSQTNPFPNHGQKTFELEVTRAEIRLSITFNLSSTLRPTIVGPCITTWSIFGQNQ